MSLSWPYTYGRGDLSINSNPQGAYIYIDGYPLVDESNNPMKTPVKVIEIPEGIHQIQISLDGYYSKKVFKDIIPNQTSDISVTLESIYY